jgi:uncharacterized protein involved in propanediol utilization
LELAAARVGLGGARIEVLARRSDLPTGVGMGSSTADVVAAARAVADAMGHDLSPDDLAVLAGTIEPSDPTMYDGMVLAPRRGAAISSYAWSPELAVVALIPADGRATERVELAGQYRHAAAYDRILEDLELAATEKDADAFGSAAVRSARLHQQVLPNTFFDVLPDLAILTGAAGWNVAHTGSAAGLLYLDAEQADRAIGRVRDRVTLRVQVRRLRSPASAPRGHNAGALSSTGA